MPSLNSAGLALLTARLPQGKDEAEAVRISLEPLEMFLRRSLAVTLGDNSFSALLSFVAGVGIGTVAHLTVMTLVNSAHLAEAADAMLLFVRDNGRVVPDLVARRTEERALFLRPDEEPGRPPPAANDQVAAPRPGQDAADAQGGWPAQVAQAVGRWFA